MVLYNVCKDQNPQTFFVSRVDEIDFSWFDQGNTVGICGATSTPMWLMEDVQKALQSM